MRTGIALGSNVGDRLLHLVNARKALESLPNVSSPILHSKVYETEPVGDGAGTATFLNAAVELNYSGAPLELMQHLQEIETCMGRPSKRPQNAPRTIDLDILYMGNLILSKEGIVIPHPRLHLRRFVLQPLTDIVPDLILPNQPLPIRELLATLPGDESLELFTDHW